MDYWRGGGGGGGGGQRVCWSPLKLLGGPGPPSSYAYGIYKIFVLPANNRMEL